MEGLFCFLALLGTVVLAGAIGGITAPEKPHHHPVANNASQTADLTLAFADLVAQQEMANWALGTMIGGFVAALVSLTALHFLRGTLLETQQTLNETQKRNALEMRAYVVVIPQGIEQDVGEARFRGQVELHNIGKTPAQNVSARVWMKQSTFEAEADEFKNDAFRKPAERTLLPEGRMRQGSKTTFPLSDFDEWPGFIFVYGRVDYTDYLGQRRSTTFCHRYNKEVLEADLSEALPSKPRVLIRSAMARHHIHGNIAD